jgi:multidrug efflux pump subunit AcrB
VIGLVVLIELAAKNAILIVEFTKEREDAGLGRVDAAVQASKMRLRPILMTLFACILGLVPLVLAKGRAPRCVTRSAWRSLAACSA